MTPCPFLKWKKAVEEEIGVLEKNATWKIVAEPKDEHVVGCKWVFTLKYKADGTIERYKARLVAKGFAQTYKVDYTDICTSGKTKHNKNPPINSC